jgi:SPP1 family predicted phage head-tail adaptor
MATGAYRHKVAVDNPGESVPDGDGGFTTGWAPADPPIVEASIEAASVRALERETAGTVAATATHLIRTRYHKGITTLSRLTFEGRIFEVQTVINVDERDVALLLVCAEAVGGREGETARAAPPPVWGTD